jgi:hypothetical protein
MLWMGAESALLDAASGGLARICGPENYDEEAMPNGRPVQRAWSADRS